MTTLREAAEKALAALESIDVGFQTRHGSAEEVSFDEDKANAAKDALRTALAECDIKPTSAVAACSHAVITATGEFYGFPKREWQSLTDEEIEKLWPAPPGTGSIRLLARIIEQALKERNT